MADSRSRFGDRIERLADEAARERAAIDPDPPDAESYTAPFGVVVLFTDRAEELPDRFREAYDCPRGADTRPAFDPYGV